MNERTKFRVNPALAPLLVDIERLQLDPKNARRHRKRDLAVLSVSLAEHGQQKPIVTLADGRVIAGNGTLEAARSLGWTHLAAVAYDGEDEAKAAAFAIVDNRSAELSEWDFEVLSSTLKQLPDTLRAGVGFTEHELAPLLAASWEPPDIIDLPAEPAGRHVVAFDDDEWRAVEAWAESMSRVRGVKIKPAEAIIEACRIAALR